MEFHRKKRLWLLGVAALVIGLALIGVFVVLLRQGDLAHVRRNRYILVGIGGVLVIAGIAFLRPERPPVPPPDRRRRDHRAAQGT